MQVALAQLSNHLQRALSPLYVLHGDEPLLQQEAADAIRATARAQGYTERSSYTVAGAHFDWSAVLAAGGSLSLFADKQIVEIRIPSGKPGKDGSQALQSYCEQAVGNDGLLTIVTLCDGYAALPNVERLYFRDAAGAPRRRSRRRAAIVAAVEAIARDMLIPA